ncbi:MAG: hypothetical protein AAGG01_17145, partial [Planctomycetota bacterium]
LSSSTLHSSLYSVATPGVRTAAGLPIGGSSSSFFVVRAGTWSAAESITTGGAAAGGVTIADDLSLYATIEAHRFVDNPDRVVWSNSITAARFGNPWLFPTPLYMRTSTGPEYGVQLQTSRLGLTDHVGFFRIGEGDPNEGQATNFENILRVPVGVRDSVYGLQFGPTQTIQGLSDGIARVDNAMAPDPGNGIPGNEDDLGVGQPHFSFNPLIAAKDRDVGAVFWAISRAELEPGSTGLYAFTRQRVYANALTAGLPPANPADVTWADWGPSATLSDESVEHNSWPLMATDDDGAAYALWWSATTTEGLFADEVDRYWLSTWTPGGDWTAAVDVTPSGEAGTLPAITDLKVIEPAVGSGQSRRLLVLAREDGEPSARMFDLSTGSFAGPSTRPNRVASSDPDFVVFQRPTASDYTDRPQGGLQYGNRIRSGIGRMTPKAASLGANDFLVRWTDVSGAGGQPVRVIAAMYCADQPSPWGASQDLTPVANVNTTDPSTASIDLAVDGNGWATLMFTEMEASGVRRLKARRTNLFVTGLDGLMDPSIPTTTIGPDLFDVSSPSLSNIHSSGAVVVSWVYRYLSPNSDVLGSAASRFQ